VAANPIKRKLLADIKQDGSWEEVFERGAGSDAHRRFVPSKRSLTFDDQPFRKTLARAPPLRERLAHTLVDVPGEAVGRHANSTTRQPSPTALRTCAASGSRCSTTRGSPARQRSAPRGPCFVSEPRRWHSFRSPGWSTASSGRRRIPTGR
jgi:hypothetical protein